MLPIKHISVSIHASPTLTYGYAANPLNLHKWAAGLSSGVRQGHDEWITDSPMGEVKVKFVEKNALGVLDHVVTLPNGEEVLNPLRVLPNGEGSEVVFTLYHRASMSKEDFDRDAKLVTDDLQRLKKILESR